MNRILLSELNNDATIYFIERPGIDFAIKKEIGRGASCVVYHAVCSDNTEHLLKEYYPKHLELQRDDAGRMVVPKEKRVDFEQGLVRFRTGCERQKDIRLSNEGLKNFTCNVQGYYKANGTEYIDMTCFNGQTYDHVQEKSVYNLMLRMRTLVQVVGNYHKVGLLHLDIKPENIYVRPEDETIEDVMLFDFDSVTPISDVVTSKLLSCTKTWAAPEQLLPEKRKSICPATDLFAIGEIIFVQLFGRHSTSGERRSFVTKYCYDYSKEIFKDMNPKVFPLLDDLLCHTICGVVEKRYQSAEELIGKLDELIKLANPEAPYLKSSLPAVQDFFVGRESEINEIHQKLSENHILFLRGIGGIGKSELAKHYALKYKGEYDAIIFAPYVSDVDMLIQDDNAISLCNFTLYPEEKMEEYCARKLRKLQELCDERTLFIVDNLDCEDDPDLNKLLNLGGKLLITTRMDFSDYGYGQQLLLDALADRSEIRKIFDKHYTKPLTEEENACVEQIIDLVAGHTMTVELLAKQMMAGRVKPDKMLAKLQEGGISESGKEKIRSGKDGVLSAQSAYGHIQALFDLSEMNKDEQYILANLSLIPYTGISTELFHDWCELDGYDGINNLVVEGWIRFDKEQDYISLHPVITDITIHLLKTDITRSNIFFVNVKETADSISVDFNSMSLIIPLIETIAKRIIHFELESCEIASFLRTDLWGAISSYGNHESLQRYYQSAVRLTQKLESTNADGLIDAYGNIACLYIDMDLLEEAEKFTQMALDICHLKYTGVENECSITLYNNLALIYDDTNENDKAYQFYNKALAVCEKLNNGSYDDLIATIHHNMACLLQKGENLVNAQEHFYTAASIWKELYGDQALQLAYVYGGLGELYKIKKDYEKAEDFIRRALLIKKEALGEDNTDVATSLYMLGCLCQKMKRTKEATEYLEKALQIRREILGDNHPKTLEAAKELASI